MGLLEFGVFCIVVVGIAWLIVYGLGTLVPDHPKIVDRIIWFVAVLIIIVRLASAMGLWGLDPKIPRFQ